MTTHFARWLAQFEEWRRGVSLAPQGQGEETSVFSTLAWPPWITAILVASLAVWIGWNYWRERGAASHWVRGLLAATRMSVALLLVFMLQGWMVQRHRTDLPDLVLLIDVSGSMETRDAAQDTSLREGLAGQLANAQLGESTRLNLARLLLLDDNAECLKLLAEKHRLKLYAISAMAQPLDSLPEHVVDEIRRLEASGTASRLGKSLRDVLEAQRGRPTSAVIVLSDGINTEGRSLSEAAEYARRKMIPLYLVGIGNDRPPRDARITDLLVESDAFVNDLVQFDLKIAATGMAGAKTKVVLRRKGETETLAEDTVTIETASEVKPVRLTHRPTTEGDWEYVVSLEPAEPDVNPENDAVSASVHVHNATIRVLLVQSSPSYEFRFLKTMLERELNPNDLALPGQRGFQVVLQDADVQFAETDKSMLRNFPVTRDELFHYDVILFGDANPSYFSQAMLQNISDFVTERGGGMVFIAGPRFNPIAYRDTPLAALLPIDVVTVRVPELDSELTQEIRPRPTSLGFSSPPLQLSDSRVENVKLWSQHLPGLYWFVETPDIRSGARVLLEHPTKTGSQGTPLPLLSLQFIGSGKVMFQAFDSSYRWRFRAGDEYFARYWIQTIRYLSRSKVLGSERGVELVSDRDEYRRGEPILLRVKFVNDRLAPADDNGVSLMLERQGMPRRSIAVQRASDARGVFETTLSNLAEGRYRAWLATPSLEGQPPAKQFTITAPPGEQARLETDVAELKAAAKISSGRYYGYHRANEMIDDLPPGRQVRIESLPPEPIWNSPLLAGLVLVLLVTEWLVRKKMGML